MSSLTTDTPFLFSAGMRMPGGDASTPPVGAPDAAGAASADDLVRETRREIAEIIREVAALARQHLHRSHFFSALIDRTVRALAAEGAVIWDFAGPQPQAVVRTGRVTDHQIPAAGRPAHDRMLAEVVASGSPVVVPPTPIQAQSLETMQDVPATNDVPATVAGPALLENLHLPANPTDRPAAVIPILDPLEAGADTASGSGSRYVLEVFLESDAGVATQRGYLRFAAQMADLAGDFLRLDEIRRARAAARLDARLDEILPRLHRHDTLTACAAEIADSAAELFDAARATLVRVGRASRWSDPANRPRRRGAKILAISHVEAIDHRGAACGRLLDQAIGYEVPEGQTVWTPESVAAGNAADPLPQRPSDSAEHTMDDAPLFPVAVIALGDAGQYRVLLQSTWPATLDDPLQRVAKRFAVHAAAALRSSSRIESVPFARAWLACLPASAGAGREGFRSLIGRLGLAAVAALMIAMVAMVPRPMTVTLAATLRAEHVRTHYAPCDAIVQQVLVRHGEQVAAGQPMLLLRDIALEEQTTTLIARRSVIGEKLSRVFASLVQAPGGGAASRPDEAQASDDALVQQQRLLEEELRGIDGQLELLADARERLVLRSDRDGRVDAWQTERMALGRPVRAGEPLVRVQPLLSSWVADARIPQNRSEIVFRSLAQTPDQPVQVRLETAGQNRALARYVRHTGFESSAAGAASTALVEFRLDLAEDVPGADLWLSGAPVEVAVNCGTLPLAHVLFFDFVRSIRLQWARWS